MVLNATGTVSAPREDTAQFYIPSPVSRDSRFPFGGGDGFRVHIAPTAAGDDVLVICPTGRRLAADETSIVLERAVERDAESSIDHADPGENGANPSSN